MERSARVVLVVTFIVLTTAALVAFYRWISQPDPTAEDTQHAILFSGSVSGLSIGSDVRYLGVPVGRVSSIALSREYSGHVHVAFGSDEPLPAAESLVALLEPQGITGLSVIELRDRSSDSPGFATPAGTIPGYPSVFGRLTDSAGRIATSLEATLLRIQDTLGDEVLADLAATLQESRILTHNLANASSDIQVLMASAARVSQELERAMPDIRRVTNQLQSDVLPAVAAAGTSLEQTAAGLDETVAANRGNIERLLSRDLPALVGTTDELAVTLQRLSAVLASLSDEPGALLYGKQVREVEIARD